MNNEINLGPLKKLVGKWRGDKGKDVAPEPGDVERNDYYEELEFRLIGDVENALEQELVMLHYELIARRISNDELLHHQTGYWTWDAKDNSVCNSFTIGRRVAVIAMGNAIESKKNIVFKVAASLSDTFPSIAESQFMAKKASTKSFTMEMTVTENELSYQQITLVDIYGQKAFEHTDQNVLVRVNN